jgi:hypothetical protein
LYFGANTIICATPELVRSYGQSRQPPNGSLLK